MPDTKPNVLDVLGAVSGLGSDETRRIWQQVQENHRKLDTCPGPHEFGPLEAKFNARYRCTKCGGEISAVDRSWYERGLAHGGKREQKPKDTEQ